MPVAVGRHIADGLDERLPVHRRDHLAEGVGDFGEELVEVDLGQGPHHADHLARFHARQLGQVGPIRLDDVGTADEPALRRRAGFEDPHEREHDARGE